MTTPSIVQVNQNSQTATVASYAQAFSGNVTIGNYIYMACEHAGQAGINLATDSMGNTWHQFGSTLANGTIGQMAHFWAQCKATGANTVQANFAATNTFPAIYIAEVTATSGPDLNAGLGFSSNYQNTVGAGVGAVTSGNCTPSAPGGLLLGVTMDSVVTDTMSVDTAAGFTDLFAAVAFWRFTDPNNHGAALSGTYGSTSPLAALFTASSTTSAPGSLAALWLPSGGGGGAPQVSSLSSMTLGPG